MKKNSITTKELERMLGQASVKARKSTPKHGASMAHLNKKRQAKKQGELA